MSQQDANDKNIRSGAIDREAENQWADVACPNPGLALTSINKLA